MRLATYKGRLATELTREELIAAYTHAVAELDNLRRMAREDFEMEREFEKTRAVLRSRRNEVDAVNEGVDARKSRRSVG